MEQRKLISLALNFASFLVGKVDVISVILFGSVAQNIFDEESDIDIFIETGKKNKEKIRNLFDIYKKSEEYEKFRLDGIKNEIALKIGRLDEWKSLKRSIISEGIVLYGNYRGKPERLNHKAIFSIDVENLKRAEKIKAWRKIYGYKQKIGKKIYISNGLAEKKLGRGAFIVSVEKMKEVQNYLIKNKIKYYFFDIWVE